MKFGGTTYNKAEIYIRMPIPENTRLEICLRYLASGNSMKSPS